MTRRRGISMLQGVLVMPIILGFGSFAVDFGRVQLARNELSTAADAAALYAAQGLGDNTAITRARTAAMENRADGRGIPSGAISTLTGRWANGAFTSGATPTNAVSVTLKYRRADGNAVPLTLGSVLGLLPIEVTRNSIALAGDGDPDVIGLDSVVLANGGSIRNWDSSNGTLPAFTSTSAVEVGSNGVWTTTGGGYIEGKAAYTGTAPPAGMAKGGATLRDTAFAQATESIPAGATNLGAIYVAANTVSSLSSGIYYCSNVTVDTGARINLNIINGAPVRLYVTGTMNVVGGATINVGGLPKNFEIHALGTGSLTLTNSSKIYATLVSSTAMLDLTNSSEFRGAAVAKILRLSNSAILYFDVTLRAPENAKTSNLVK